MANNPVVNTLTFTGSVAGQATIQAQGIAGSLTFLLPNTAPIQGQLLDVQAVNGNNVFLGWVSPSSSSISLSQILQSGATSGQVIEWNGSAWAPSSTVPGSGTVTSVALTVPSWLSVAGSPITGAGTLAVTAASGQTANQVLATPNGSSGALSVRALVAADIPALPYLSNSTVIPNNRPAASHNFITAYDNTTGNFSIAQPAVTDVSGAAPLASPTFTGVPAAPTATPLTNSTQIATTAYADAAVAVETTRATGVEALKAPLASPTFTGLVTLPVAASTTGLTMLSDNNQINSTNAPIVLSSATATNPQVITITPNSFFGPQIQFTGQNTPYTVGRLVEIGAQGLYLSNAGFAINGQLGTSGQVLTTLGVAGDGGPAGLAWHSLVVGDVSGAAPLASPTFTGTVVLPSAVNATGGSDLIFTNTGANKIRIATATGIFDFFGTGGGMTLGSQNSQVAIDASGNISLSATGGSNLSVNSAGGLVTSSDFKPTNLFSFPGNTSGTAGQVFTSLGSDTGTAWISQSGTGGNTIASAKTNLTTATAGNIVTADGSGNVQDSGVPVANVLLKSVTVLSSAQLLALGTTPVQVIPAPGVGKYNSPLYGVASYHFGTTPYTGAGTGTHFFVINDANEPNVTTAFGLESGFIDSLGTSTSSVIQIGENFGFSATAANLDNQAFTISFDTASNILTLGDGTVTITLYYTIESSAA